MTRDGKPKGVETVVANDKSAQVDYQRNLFLLLLTTMTWQLAVAVLVPLLGGYYLDQYLGTTPWLLVVGAVLALLGVIGVMINIVRLANRRTNPTANEAIKSKDNKK